MSTNILGYITIMMCVCVPSSEVYTVIVFLLHTINRWKIKFDFVLDSHVVRLLDRAQSNYQVRWN